MKRVITIFIPLFMVAICFMPFLENKQKSIVEFQRVAVQPKDEKEQIVEEIVLQDIIEIAVEKMQNDMLEIEDIENQKEWYIAYKEIIEKYANVLDPPETIYDYFTEDEIYLIQRTVETECYDKDFNSKCNVASVILNRIESSGEFGESVEHIITAKNQFVYTREEITDDTVLAVEYAFEIKDTTNGCIAFRSDKKVKTWYGWNWSFTDSSGHHFYKQETEEW